MICRKSRFWTIWGLAIALLLAAGLPATADVKVGDKPEFTFKLINGRKAGSDDLRGRIVVLEFWATWCGPCKAQIPHIKKLNEAYDGKGVEIVGISWDSNARTVATFTRNEAMNWTQAIDVGQSLGKQFGINGIPHAVILSPHGEVVWRGHPAGIDQPLAAAFEKYPTIVSMRNAARAHLDAARKALDSEDGADYAKALTALGELEQDICKDKETAQEARTLIRDLRPVGGNAERIQKALDDNKTGAARLKALENTLTGRKTSTASKNVRKLSPAAIARLKARIEVLEKQGKTEDAERLREIIRQQEEAEQDDEDATEETDTEVESPDKKKTTEAQ